MHHFHNAEMFWDNYFNNGNDSSSERENFRLYKKKVTLIWVISSDGGMCLYVCLGYAMESMLRKVFFLVHNGLDIEEFHSDFLCSTKRNFISNIFFFFEKEKDKNKFHDLCMFSIVGIL